jgi:hypothetical protein
MYTGFEVSTTVTIVWDVTSSSLVSVCDDERTDSIIVEECAKPVTIKMCSLLDLLFDPEDGCRTFLRNIGKFLPDSTASLPRRLNLSLQFLHKHLPEKLVVAGKKFPGPFAETRIQFIRLLIKF